MRTNYISDQRILRFIKASDTIKCIKLSIIQDKEIFYNCKIFDGGALVHFLKPGSFSIFQQYTENILIKYICSKLSDITRVDIVWDQCFDNSLKNKTREKCGRGIRRKVSLQTAIPCNWKGFLHNSKNKIELFDFLTKPVSEYQFENKEVQITKRNTMLTVAVAGTNSIAIYTHKEADTGIIIRLLDAAEKGMKNIIIRTVDSDILRIVLGQFELTR